MTIIKINQKVSWTSHSGGYTKSKTGTVVAVIPPHAHIPYEWKKRLDAPGLPRDHESYLVLVPGKTERSAGKLYWPIVKKLSAA